jgi:hypothetical protein
LNKIIFEIFICFVTYLSNSFDSEKGGEKILLFGKQKQAEIFSRLSSYRHGHIATYNGRVVKHYLQTDPVDKKSIRDPFPVGTASKLGARFRGETICRRERKTIDHVPFRSFYVYGNFFRKSIFRRRQKQRFQENGD